MNLIRREIKMNLICKIFGHNFGEKKWTKLELPSIPRIHYVSEATCKRCGFIGSGMSKEALEAIFYQKILDNVKSRRVANV